MLSNYLLLVGLALPALVSAGSHYFWLQNNCGYTVNPRIVNTNCGYSPRCNTPTTDAPKPAISYTGPQPASIAPGGHDVAYINEQWVGRIFHQSGSCGSKGEGCSITEFNLDTGNVYTAQAYDISNIQGFTQSLQIGADNGNCQTVTCRSVNCACNQAYKPGDLSGSCNYNNAPDNPVRGCGAGDVGFSVVFCP